jgi:hypothetical protein
MFFPDEPAERKSRFRLPGVTWAVVAALVSYVVFWFVMAGQFRDSVRTWAEGGDGIGAAYSSLALGGFPFLVRLSVEDAELSQPGLWAWRGPRIVLEARPWSPWRVRVRAPGDFEIDLPGRAGPVTWKGGAGELSADVTFEGGRAGDIRIRISDFELSAADDRLFLASGSVRLHQLGGEDADHLTASADLRVEARDLQAPGDFPLGPRLDRLSLTARVMGGIGRGAGALGAWRDKGGTVEVTDLTFDYGPLEARANGTVALDGDMQPVGVFTARIRGFFQTVDALKARGLIRARDALTAKMVLGVLARKADDGGPPILSLAVTVQDRKVYVGPVALAEVPEVRWP